MGRGSNGGGRNASTLAGARLSANTAMSLRSLSADVSKSNWNGVLNKLALAGVLVVGVGGAVIIMNNTPEAREHRKWLNSLTSNQKEAIGLYQKKYFEAVNQVQRTGTIKDSNIYEGLDKSSSVLLASAYGRSLDKAIAGAPPLKQDAKVFRGVTGSQFAHDVFDQVQNGTLATGKTFTDKAYTSTSRSTSIAHGFATMKFADKKGVVFNITVPKGTRALDVGKVTKNKDYAHERELLLGRNANLRVTGSRMVGKVAHVDVEYVP